MKKIRVKGYLKQSGSNEKARGKKGSLDEEQHSHDLYITSWGGIPVYHVHHFSGVTSYEDGHVHQYVGTTEAAPTGVPHVHHYHTVTSFNDGHNHTIYGTTGPAVDIPGGGHIHYFEGFTTVNGRNPHAHHYRGSTGNEV